jgi:uncharacterized protein
VILCALCGKCLMFAIRDTAGASIFQVKLRARARKTALTGELGDAIQVSITAPPVDGKANEACIVLFANLLKVPRSSITIASGQNSPNKVIRVTGISALELRKRLQLLMRA